MVGVADQSREKATAKEKDTIWNKYRDESIRVVLYAFLLRTATVTIEGPYTYISAHCFGWVGTHKESSLTVKSMEVGTVCRMAAMEKRVTISLRYSYWYYGHGLIRRRGQQAAISLFQSENSIAMNGSNIGRSHHRKGERVQWSIHDREGVLHEMSSWAQEVTIYGSRRRETQHCLQSYAALKLEEKQIEKGGCAEVDR